jgi:hypothetical protein
MICRFTTLVFVLLAAFQTASHAAVVTGDIQLLGYRSDDPDEIAFVSWVDVTVGETLWFTDSGFFNDGTVRDTEQRMSWTAGSNLAAGTVVVITTESGVSTADTGSTTEALFGLSSVGDQVFVGSSAFPVNNDTTKPGSSYSSGDLLFGLDFSGPNTTWDSDSTSSDTSALPTTLTADQFNIAVSHFDNGQYTGTRSGLSVAEFKIQIDNPANWSFANDVEMFGSLNSTDFAIAAVPEPSSVAALVIGSGAVVLARRRKRAA